MCTDTLHFRGDMLGIAGTSSIPTEHDLPLASQRCHQLAGYLHDATRHGGQLLDNGAMLVQRFGDLHLHVHSSNPFLHNALSTLSGVRGDKQITRPFGRSPSRCVNHRLGPLGYEGMSLTATRVRSGAM